MVSMKQEWASVRPRNMREQQNIVGRGAMMAIAATFAVCAVVALSTPQRQALQQSKGAHSSSNARFARKHQALRSQVLQEAPPPLEPAAPAGEPPMAATPAVAAEAPAMEPVAVAPVATAPVAFAPVAAAAPMPPAPAAPLSIAPLAVAPPSPLPQPPVASAPRAPPPVFGAAAAALQEAEAEKVEEEAHGPKPFNADIDNGGARSYGLQKTEDGKKDWSSIGQVHGGKTMAQAGGMGSAGPATAEAGLDETLEDYAKVKTERRQAMDFCSSKFSDWGNIQKCIFLLLKNAHY